MSRLLRIYTLIAVLLCCILPSSAQLQRRSPKQMVKGGIIQRPDTMSRQMKDSLNFARLRDSLKGAGVDSLKIEELLLAAHQRTDSLALSMGADSLLGGRLLDSLGRSDSLFMSRNEAGEIDSLKRKKGWFMSDSMSLSKVCWLSTVLPGYGQIYNKDYWKLPILYGLVGTGIGMVVHENKTYKPLKQEYDRITAESTTRTPELDQLQQDMIRSNTRRQLYLGATIASYLYFIGDAAVNYSTNEVSNVKKATTLACICPGAGQIYNKSYWKVPFVVGGFGTVIYCVDWNNRGYQRFKKAYSLRADYDKQLEAYNADPENVPKPTGSKDEFRGRYTASFLKNLRDNYRRNRDLCIIITAGLYALQIIDAHVDAHMQDYDISDDLSMHIEPVIDYNYIPSAGGHKATFGFSLNVNF